MVFRCPISIIAIFIIVFYSINSKANDFIADAISCDKTTKAYGEIHSLMNVISTEILGTVPLFCRESSHEQLNDKTENSHLDLTKFVNSLEILQTDKPDIIPNSIADEAFLRSAIFETMKYVILRNNWRESTEDSRVKLLIDEDCAAADINRISRVVKIAGVKKNKDEHHKLENSLTACKARNMDDLAPFISNDVIAEFFLNIKNVLPQSYSKVKEMLCEDFYNMEDLILKNSFDKKYAGTKAAASEVEEFGQWYEAVIVNIKESSELGEKAQQKVSSAVPNSSIIPGLFNPPLSKEDKKNYYEKHYVKGQKLIHPDFPDYNLVKNSKGEVIWRYTEKAKKEKIDQYLQFINTGNDHVKEQIDLVKASLNATYDSSQSQEQSTDAVKMDKDKNGKYILKLNSETAKKLKENANELMDSPTMESIMQEQYKNEYEKYLADPNYFSDKDEFGILVSKIKKDADGKYTYDYGVDFPSSINFKDAVIEETLKHMSDESDKSILPGIMPNTYYVKAANGKYLEVSHYMNSSKGFIAGGELYEINENYGETTEGNLRKEILASKLKDGVAMKFQEEAKLVKKLDELDKEELVELRSYTGMSFQELNSCLRSNDCDEGQTDKINKVNSSLNKIRSEDESERYLYRGSSNLPDFVKEKLENNEKGVILDKGFMSTSGDLATAKSFSMTVDKNSVGTGYILLIKAKSCVGISAISNFKDEDEFLCPPGMKFDVKKVEGENRTYLLEEVR